MTSPNIRLFTQPLTNHEAWPSEQLHLLYAVVKITLESFDSKKHGVAVISALPGDSSVEDHERERERIITAPLSKGVSTTTSLASESVRSKYSVDNEDPEEGPSEGKSGRDWRVAPQGVPGANINRATARDSSRMIAGNVMGPATMNTKTQYNVETQNFYYGKIYKDMTVSGGKVHMGDHNDTTSFGPGNQGFQANRIGRDVSGTNFYNEAPASSSGYDPTSQLTHETEALNLNIDEDIYTDNDTFPRRRENTPLAQPISQQGQEEEEEEEENSSVGTYRSTGSRPPISPANRPSWAQTGWNVEAAQSGDIRPSSSHTQASGFSITPARRTAPPATVESSPGLGGKTSTAKERWKKEKARSIAAIKAEKNKAKAEYNRLQDKADKIPDNCAPG